MPTGDRFPPLAEEGFSTEVCPQPGIHHYSEPEMNMFQKARSMIVTAALAVALVPSFGSEASAQAVDATFAQQFVGSWQLTMETPGGPQAQTLTVAQADAGLAVSIAGGEGGMPAPQFTSATRKDETLVALFKLAFEGMEFPLTVNLRRDGEGLVAQWVFGDGEFQMEAKGTRKQ